MIRNFVIVIASMVFVMAAFLPRAAQAQGNQNEVPFASTEYVNGAVGADTQGFIRTVHDPSLDPESNPLFAVDENGVPTQFDTFQLFPGAFLDMEVVANDMDFLTGILMLDKFGGVHTQRFLTLGDPEVSVSATSGPQLDYAANLAEFNANNPDNPVFLPYFPFNLPIPTATDGVARDLEVAVDWREATNAFQGYYILDAFGAVHYVNNPEILGLLARQDSLASDNTYTEGMNTFREIFGFRPQYLLDYDGQDENGETQTRPAPYFRFTGNNGFPIARDLEVLTRFIRLDPETIQESIDKSAEAESEGIDTSQIFSPIAMEFERLNPASEKFANSVPIPTGYAILDGFGAIHSMVEDEEGNVLPAPWEDEENGMTPDAPYFLPFDLAVDIEVMPNGGGLLLLNRIGEVFVINAQGKTDADNFAAGDTRVIDDLPQFGFDAARDLTVVSNDEGKIVGLYVLDRFGTIHRGGQVPSLPGSILYFLTGNSRSLELSPIVRPVTAPQPLTAAQ